MILLVIEYAVFAMGLHLTALPYILTSIGVFSPLAFVLGFVGPLMMFAALKRSKRS